MIEPQVRTAISLWYKKGLNILDDIEAVNWKITLPEFTYLLTYHFRFEDIYFSITKSPTKFNKYVDSATFFDGAAIEVFVTPDSLRYLRKLCHSKEDYMLRWMDFRRNQFVYEYVEVLSHELIHRVQHYLGAMNDHRRTDTLEFDDYFSDASEIQAHAQDIAFFMVYGRNDWRSRYYVDLYRYFGNDSSQFKRFMKQVYKFVEKMKQDQIGLLP